jgi:hypothetical protein
VEPHRDGFHGKWGWNKLAPHETAPLHVKLLDYERETLASLKRQKRAREIPTEDLCPEARAYLETTRRDDNELWELRLGQGVWRVWGSIRGSIFYLLWWDPEHTVCKGTPSSVRRS